MTEADEVFFSCIHSPFLLAKAVISQCSEEQFYINIWSFPFLKFVTVRGM